MLSSGDNYCSNIQTYVTFKENYKHSTRDILKDMFLIELYEAKTGDITIITEKEGKRWADFGKRYHHPQQIGAIFPKNVAKPFSFFRIATTRLHNLCLSLYPHNLSIIDYEFKTILCFHSCSIVEATNMFHKCLTTIKQKFSSQEFNISTTDYIILVRFKGLSINFYRLIHNTKQGLLSSLGYSVDQIILDVRDKSKSQEAIYNTLNNSSRYSEGKYEFSGTISGLLCTALSICPINIQQSHSKLLDLFEKGNIIIFPGLDISITHKQSSFNNSPENGCDHSSEDKYDYTSEEESYDVQFTFPDGKLGYDNNLYMLETEKLDELGVQNKMYSTRKFIIYTEYIDHNISLFKDYIQPPRKITYVRSISSDYNPMIIGIDNYRLFLFRKWIKPYYLPKELFHLLVNAWLKAEVQDAKQRLLSLTN